MKQYKIIADFGQDEPVGSVQVVNISGQLIYRTKTDNLYAYIYPHEIAMMCKLGFIEEVKEEKEWSPWDLKEGDRYWATYYGGVASCHWYNDYSDHFYRGAGLIFRTEEEAQAKYEEIISKGRGNN